MRAVARTLLLAACAASCTRNAVAQSLDRTSVGTSRPVANGSSAEPEAATASPGAARPAPRDGARWVSFGLGTGPVQWDRHLADYQWDVRPRLSFCGQAFAGVRRLGLGVRFTEARTRQSIGTTASTSAPAVIARTFEVAARGSVLSFHGTEVLATASAGRLHVAWNPRHVTLAAPGAPIEVDLVPVDAWSAGFGVGMQRALRGPWLGRIELDRRAFGWETAHRSGSQIEVGRESFGNWSARLEVDWIRRSR